MNPSEHGGVEVVKLPWDSQCFGFPVGRIPATVLTEEELEEALRRAGEAQLTLVYWDAEIDRDLSPHFLARHGAQNTSRRVVYRKELALRQQPADELKEGPWIRQLPPAPAPAKLVELAIEAGACSRFRRDHRFPHELFRKLYTSWADRSARGIVADALLLASGGSVDQIVGFVTIQRRGDEATVGLIAVDKDWRRRRVGQRLVAAAERWMRDNGSRRALVATQQENRPACRLYERLGYQIETVRDSFHFWL